MSSFRYETYRTRRAPLLPLWPGVRFSMAFQPTVDVSSGAVFAYEALARGLDGAGAEQLFAGADPVGFAALDEACRVRAIELAAGLGLPATGARLALNYSPAGSACCTRLLEQTVEAAACAGIDCGRLLLEIPEQQSISEAELERILAMQREHGFGTVIEGFRGDHNGLHLLARLRPHLVKMDMELTRGVGRCRRSGETIDAIVGLCAMLGVGVAATGIETAEEMSRMVSAGVGFFQGYLFTPPQFEALPAGPFLPYAAIA